MTDYNPVKVEQAIRNCANRIAGGVSVCSNTYSAFLDADRAYDQAFAKAYLEAGGAAHERKYIAELATDEERSARDLADAAYRYADRQAKALEAELRAWQSVGASVRSMYGVAGRGES
ncbi:hypothetical protein [Rhodococcus sp. BE178]|uniref:hypothetical protein n=1 Tax=Rhodococcus sp. BE178 TaxID=2817737 RepID=UPI003D255BC7